MESREIRSCRLCQSDNLRNCFSLQATPPANEFVSKPGAQDVFPLALNQCFACGHLQLGTAVNPDRLFRNYVYISGTSPVFVKHFSQFADTMVSRGYLNSTDAILEIGSNDGTLLNQFKQRGYDRVWGFEPASKIATQAWNNHRVITIPDFFTPVTYANLRSSIHGSPKLIIANNVFAHIESLRSTTKLISDILDKDGLFVFEVSYFVDVLQKTLFDTIYHEHLDYHTLYPLCSFFDSFGLRLFDVERIDTHGGSIRCYVDRGVRPVTDTVRAAVFEERTLGLVPGSDGFAEMQSIKDFDKNIEQLGKDLNAKIDSVIQSGKKIIGYGAPAKATTLMYEFGLGIEQVFAIVDDSPWKQGLFSPGKNIPIIDSSSLRKTDYDYILILAWNFAEAIISKYQGKTTAFLTPLPQLGVTLKVESGAR